MIKKFIFLFSFFFILYSSVHAQSPTPYTGSPFNGPHNIPGTIQIEDYDNGGEGVAYHDLDSTNQGGQYRTNEGVDIEATGDTEGGYDVGWIQAGEWLKYTVNVTQTGTYTLDLRVANTNSGGVMHMEVDGVNVTSNLSIPQTGGWQTWTTITSPSFSLSQGPHILKLSFDTNSSNGYVGNVNYFTFTLSGPSPTPTIPIGNGDANLDGKVDTQDLMIVLKNYGASASSVGGANQYGDNIVNMFDFNVVLNAIQNPSPTPTRTPTPTTQPPTSTPFPTPSGGPVYPLKASSNKRFLVDQNNTPFLIAGDSAHELITNVSETDVDTYLASREAAGINSIWVQLLCTWSGRSNGSTYDGIVPFTTTGDLSTPNEAYFKRVDDILNLAAKHHITVFLDPTETADWLDTFKTNGTTKDFNYGVYLGNRYKNFPNIVWQNGNDFQTWSNASDDAVVLAVANGIKSVDTNHIQTIELDYPTSASLNDSSWAPIVSLDSAYSYYSTYDQVLREYNRSSFIPVYFIEGVYEYQGYMGGYTGPRELRAQEYWTQLSGSTGQLYGNANLFPFPSGWNSPGWDTTPGFIQFTYWNNFFKNSAWYNLVPDQNHTVVTAGYGTYQSITAQVLGNTSDYATTARTTDGTLIVSYMPTSRTITVDMTKLSGSAAARWYDPTNGTYTTISGSPFANTGSRQFTPPGNNSGGDSDWVLVLQID